MIGSVCRFWGIPPSGYRHRCPPRLSECRVIQAAPARIWIFVDGGRRDVLAPSAENGAQGLCQFALPVSARIGLAPQLRQPAVKLGHEQFVLLADLAERLRQLRLSAGVRPGADRPERQHDRPVGDQVVIRALAVGCGGSDRGRSGTGRCRTARPAPGDRRCIAVEILVVDRRQRSFSRSWYGSRRPRSSSSPVRYETLTTPSRPYSIRNTWPAGSSPMSGRVPSASSIPRNGATSARMKIARVRWLRPDQRPCRRSSPSSSPAHRVEVGSRPIDGHLGGLARLHLGGELARRLDLDQVRGLYPVDVLGQPDWIEPTGPEQVRQVRVEPDRADPGLSTDSSSYRIGYRSVR